LSPEQVAVLEQELAVGPVAHGWPDQTWTLARIVEVARRRFEVSYLLPGMWRLLRRNGWSHQQPARRATERDEAAVAVWRREVWPQLGAPRRRTTAG
jgi:transposase